MKLLESFGFSADPDLLESYINSVSSDMEKGLKAELNEAKSGQEMIRTHKSVSNLIPKNKDIIVMDAGGTNFRSCLVHYTSDGNPLILDLRKSHMIATEKELSKEKFFSAIADQIEYLKNKSASIAFCFSYAMEILENGDGKILWLVNYQKSSLVASMKDKGDMYLVCEVKEK